MKTKIIGCTPDDCTCKKCCTLHRGPPTKKCFECVKQKDRPCQILTLEEWQKRELEYWKNLKAGET